MLKGMCANIRNKRDNGQMEISKASVIFFKKATKNESKHDVTGL